jgi:hypothetical protein
MYDIDAHQNPESTKDLAEAHQKDIRKQLEEQQQAEEIEQAEEEREQEEETPEDD